MGSAGWVLGVIVAIGVFVWFWDEITTYQKPYKVIEGRQIINWLKKKEQQ